MASDTIATTWKVSRCPDCGSQALETTERYAAHLVAMGGMPEETAYGTRWYVQCGNPLCDYADADDSGI